MKQKILLFCFLALSSATVCGQNSIPDTLKSLFHNQLLVFPQEKLYLHTDKPYYISGERIWFRAYLINASNHVPTSVSRYIYVELINPLDSIVNRVKIRKDEEEMYHGFMEILDDVPEGNYTIRAYTTFMCSLDENYFFTKNIYIGDPQTRAIHTESQFTFGSNQRVNAKFQFSHAYPSGLLVPTSVKVSINGGRTINAIIGADGTANLSFNLPANSSKRIILLEVMAFVHPYRLFINIPTPDDDFDVTFYPEGGSLMEGVRGRTAFKAMKSNGQATNIVGMIYDNTGTEIGEFNTDYLGMGSFQLLAEKGKTYYALCTNEEGQTKRFNLPAAATRGYALSVNQVRDKIFIAVQQPVESTQKNELYLLAHTRGIVHYVNRWDYERNLVIQKELFPTGVTHFILFDSNLNPVSERLFFFNNKEDQIKATYQPDKENYSARSLVKNRVTLADSDGQLLAGNFSVSVTSDLEVIPDTSTNILTQLLLESDLRGHIENPAYYFKNTNASIWALDLLMRTQGWRRYNITDLASGNFSTPTSPLEIGPEISGTVKSVVFGRPAQDITVSMMSFKDGKTGNFDSADTDIDGRFHIHGNELPDKTIFLVSATPKKGIIRLELIIDNESFPKRTLPAAPATTIDKFLLAKYADKAEKKYVFEHGIRTYNLSEMVIIGEKKPARKSVYYTSPSNSLSEDDLERFATSDIRSLLTRIPGVMISGSNISIRGGGPPLLVVDDIPFDIDYIDTINVYDIAQIDVLKEASNTSIFGMRGANGVIVIFTKEGRFNTQTKPFHIKTIFPLGYQPAEEFYAPKYDTTAKQNAQTPDLRTTIHWQPVVQTDSTGVASFEFYTADEKTSYSVIIEGLSDDGRIIRHEGKVWRTD